MSGSIQHLGGDRYRLAVYLGYDSATGTRRYRRRTHRGTPKSAKIALAELVLEVNTGNPDPTIGYTINQILDMYIEARRHIWSVTTAKSAPGQLDRWIRPQLGHIVANKLTLWELQKHISSIADTRPATARKVLALLRSALQDAVKHELVERNVARLVTAPELPKPKTSAPDPALIRAAAEETETSMAMIIRLAMITGCRRGEIVGLQWVDINWDHEEVVVSRSIAAGKGPNNLIVKPTKTGRVKVIALDGETLKDLKKWRTQCIEAYLKIGKQITPDTFLFTQWPNVDLPIHPDTITKKWRTLADRHGLKGIRFHDLRHAAATIMLGEGVSPRDAAERLGHDPAVLLRTYAHARRAVDQKSAEILARALDGK